MLVSKSFLVNGNTTHRNNGIHKDIAENVDKAINEFLANIEGELVDLKPSVQIGATQDVAFITVIMKVDSKKKAVEPEPEEISEPESKKKGRWGK